MCEYGILIDCNGYMLGFYNLTTNPPNIKSDESIVQEDVQTARCMIKARWNGFKWHEMATPEEIEEYYSYKE